MFCLRPLLFTSPFIIALAACSSNPPPTRTVASIPEESVIMHKEFSDVIGSSFRGQFIYENGDSTFIACDSEQEYDVINNNALLKVYDKISKKSSDPVYIEFSGEISFPKKITSTSSVVIRADRLHHMALAKASLQCAKPVDTFNFKAKGEVPYWRINMHEHKLFFATKVSNQSYTLEKATFNSSETSKLLKTNRLSSSNKDGQQLLLDIMPGDCYMNDGKEYWGYNTKATSIHGIFTGCGEPGHLTTDQAFQGYYLSHSQTDKKEFNLSIYEDHKLEFKQGKGTEQVIKTGYWKSNTPNILVIMLTQEGNKMIREEIILKRNGLTLSATEINKNNIVTQFETPFTFNKMDTKENSSDNVPMHINRQFTAQRISPENNMDIEVQQAVRQYFKIHRTDPKNTQFNSVRFDLNGDGKDEAIVMLDWCSNAGCEMLVFEAKDEGLRFSSRVSRVQAPITVSQSQHFSWQSLSTKKDAQTSLRLDFDGLSYPLNTREAVSVNKIADSTGVILFNKGKPTAWFPIK